MWGTLIYLHATSSSTTCVLNAADLAIIDGDIPDSDGNISAESSQIEAEEVGVIENILYKWQRDWDDSAWTRSGSQMENRYVGDLHKCAGLHTRCSTRAMTAFETDEKKSFSGLFFRSNYGFRPSDPMFRASCALAEFASMLCVMKKDFFGLIHGQCIGEQQKWNPRKAERGKVTDAPQNNSEVIWAVKLSGSRQSIGIVGNMSPPPTDQCFRSVYCIHGQLLYETCTGRICQLYDSWEHQDCRNGATRHCGYMELSKCEDGACTKKRH